MPPPKPPPLDSVATKMWREQTAAEGHRRGTVRDDGVVPASGFAFVAAEDGEGRGGGDGPQGASLGTSSCCDGRFWRRHDVWRWRCRRWTRERENGGSFGVNSKDDDCDVRREDLIFAIISASHCHRSSFHSIIDFFRSGDVDLLKSR